MSVLLLQLAGPMQAWGDSSRFVRRNTNKEPTKSGVIGLLAAAQGRNREDPIEDLLMLTFGVRIEQAGHIIRDFQTEKSLDGQKIMPLTNRYYLSDAKFLVALQSSQELLESLDAALSSPRWPLYLGRRSCPVTQPVSLGIADNYGDIREALTDEPWHAAAWYKRRYGFPDLEVVCDADEGETFETQNDLPVSFSVQHRKYASRPVHRYTVPNPDSNKAKKVNDMDDPTDSQQITGGGYLSRSESLRDHDPMSFF